MNKLRLRLAATAGLGTALAVACTFPEIEFINVYVSSSGSAGGPSSGATGTGGTGGSTSSSVGGGGAGGSTSSTTSATSTTASGTGGALPCDGSPCDCDGDGDKAATAECNFDGGDCNDHDPVVSSKQTKYFTDAGSNGYDFNCSKGEEFEITGVLTCTSTLNDCDITTLRWEGAVPGCGESGMYGVCQKMGLPPLDSCSKKIMGSKKQGCR
jgi:hypothetical protein